MEILVVLADVTEVTGAVPVLASVRRPYASTVILAFVYDPAVTAVVTRSIVGVVPPLDEIRPAVPKTSVTADALEIATHAEPVHTYIVVVVVFQYVAPTIKALPLLSRVGAEDFEPKYL